MTTAGKKFRDALTAEKPLQVIGTINAYCAMMAEKNGFNAVYLSGSGVATASYGIPDLGFTTLENVTEDARRIAGATKLPLLVDIDTGWDDPGKTVRMMQDAGVAAVHIEDQVDAKRCGHRPGKHLVSKEEMGARVKEAVAGKGDPDFIVMARCDALAGEGLDAVIDRCVHYVDCGADAIFAEAMTDLSHYDRIREAIKVPLLANMTEFGKTELYTTQQLGAHGVDMVLYPLSAFRAMSKAAEEIYQAIRRDGTQSTVVPSMQTREELYKYLDYYEFEKKLDEKLTK